MAAQGWMYGNDDIITKGVPEKNVFYINIEIHVYTRR